MTNLSVVIPIKDEKDNLAPLHERLPPPSTRPGWPRRAVFVDDGSIDGSFAVLEDLAARDPRVKVVRLRRNFGQTAALQAGIDWATRRRHRHHGRRPAERPRRHSACCWTSSTRATTPSSACGQPAGPFRDPQAAVLGANWLIRKVTGVPIKDMGCTLRVMRRDLAEALPLYGEMHRFIAGAGAAVRRPPGPDPGAAITRAPPARPSTT